MVRGLMARFIGVLAVPNAGEETRNGRTGVRETADSRRVLGDVEEDVMTVVHERELMVVEKELTTHVRRSLGDADSDAHLFLSPFL
jgi:hypothetical protein